MGPAVRCVLLLSCVAAAEGRLRRSAQQRLWHRGVAAGAVHPAAGPPAAAAVRAEAPDQRSVLACGASCGPARHSQLAVRTRCPASLPCPRQAAVLATQLFALSFSGCACLQGRARAPERGAGGCAAAVRGHRARGARHRHGRAPWFAMDPGLPADAAAHAKGASTCSVWPGECRARMAPLLEVAAACKQSAYWPAPAATQDRAGPTLPYTIPHQLPLACGRCAAVRGHAQPMAATGRVRPPRGRAAGAAARVGRHRERLERLVRPTGSALTLPYT